MNQREAQEKAIQNEISSTYWRGVFVPVIITLLIFATMFVFVTTNVGIPHDLINKIALKSPNVSRAFG
jgi:hypothetical protein